MIFSAMKNIYLLICILIIIVIEKCSIIKKALNILRYGMISRILIRNINCMYKYIELFLNNE
jgi:hypothetical protein